MSLAPAYSDDEISMIADLRSSGMEFPRIRAKLIEAGFPVRSSEAIQRALYRYVHEVPTTKRARLPTPPRVGNSAPKDCESSDLPEVKKRLLRAHERFCQAMLRERPMSGVNEAAATDSPRQVRPTCPRDLAVGHRTITASFCGDPLPGRSALDRYNHDLLDSSMRKNISASMEAEQ